MKMPSEAAMTIVERFSWSSNVSRDGRLIGQQYVVAEAIDEALAAKEAKLDYLRLALHDAIRELDKSLMDKRVLKSRIRWIKKQLSATLEEEGHSR